MEFLVHSTLVTIAMALSGGLFGWIFHWYYEKRQLKAPGSQKDEPTVAGNEDSSPHQLTNDQPAPARAVAEEEFVHVMMFPTSPKPCVGMEMYAKCSRTHCADKHDESHSNKIQKYLLSAKSTVDIAAQAITSHQIAAVLERLAKAGVRVRVIRDYNNLWLLKGTEKITSLRNHGVQFKVNGKLDPSDPNSILVAGIFHHKFIVIDGRILINGSGNFTLKAVLRNYECAVVTNLPELVNKFQKHFDQNWDNFDNAIMH